MFKRSLIFVAVVSWLGLLVPPLTAQEAETTTFTVVVNNVSAPLPITAAARFDTPVAATEPGPIVPGQQYTLEIAAAPGDVLSFATMFVESNDLFFAPYPDGIGLFDRATGDPLRADVTDQVFLWDAGTEVNEPLGTGAHQAPRQARPNSGETEANPISIVAGDAAPVVADYLRASIAPTGSTADDLTVFTLTIENVSATSAVPSALSRGVALTHSNDVDLFELGMHTRPPLQALAEDGDPSLLYESFLAPRFATEIGPLIWVVQPTATLLFDVGQEASLGIEALAEDGDHVLLVEEIEGLNGGYTFDVSAGYTGLAAVGYSYEITFSANPDDALTFVAMVAESNDWFYGVNALPLFDQDGSPITGDRSLDLRLWDAGTERDEPLGFGPNQGLRQTGPNVGPAQNGVITRLEPAADPMQPDARFALQLIVRVSQ